VPAPTPPDVREAVLRDIERGGSSTRQIGARHGVSDATVRKIAKEAGLTFSREQTKNATEAKVADNKARRAEIARKFLDKADALLDQMDQPHVAFNFGGRDNTYNEKLMDRPPIADIRNLMTSAAIAFDKHLAADRHDSDDQGLAAVDAWIRDMLGDK
jgi:transposase-like protein